jgi:transposase
MRAYSMDLRARVLAACDGGMTTAEAAEAFSVSTAWVRRLKQRRRGDRVPAPLTPRRRPPGWAAHAGRIREQVRATPDATLAELRARLGLARSLATLRRALRALRLTLKKSPAGRRAGPPGRAGEAG